MNRTTPYREFIEKWAGPQRRRRPSHRRGISALLVLLLVSITLGLSYASIRSQHTAALIHRNSDRQAAARQAAMTGMTLALKQMHTNAWAGVDTTFSGRLSSRQRFEVTFTTGDPTLSVTDPDYEELPYRVTLRATGFAADPGQTSAEAAHRVEAVVRLVPRALADEPSDWADMAKHTLYQWAGGSFEVNVPVRIEGPARCQFRLDLGTGYPWPNDARSRYLTDLGAMYTTGGGDYRPMTGPVRLPTFWQEWGVVWLLQTAWGVTVENTSYDPASLWSSSDAGSSYQLYPGGKTYQSVVLPATLADRTLQGDPATNPAGLFTRHDKVTLRENVAIRGTLLTIGGSSSDITFDGPNLQLAACDLPALYGTDEPVRLPAVISADDVLVERDSQVALTGMMLATDDFRVASDDQRDTALNVQGPVVAKDFLFEGRSDWSQSSAWWSDQYDAFLAQEKEEDGITHFPAWLKAVHGLDPAARIRIEPEGTPVRYHWNRSHGPIYVAHPDDGGLRWELLRWTDNP